MKKNGTFGAIVLALCLLSFLTPGNAHAWGFSVFTDLVHDVVKTAGGGIKEVGRGAHKITSKVKSKAKQGVKIASKAKHKVSHAGSWVWKHGKEGVKKGVEKGKVAGIQTGAVFGRGYYGAKYGLAHGTTKALNASLGFVDSNAPAGFHVNFRVKGLVDSPEHAVNYLAIPTNASKHVMDNIAPYFDFDTDSCYPATMISAYGTQNPGIKPIGKITEGCQNNNFPTQSNSWFRKVCTKSNNKLYCGYLFALYFHKDQYTIASSMDSGKNHNQKSANGQNHRHDIEHVAVWTTDGAITHVGTSAHGEMHNHPISKVGTKNGKPRIVYHKDGNRTHAFRLAGKNESKAENVTKKWQQLNVVDWDHVSPELRDALKKANYHTATLELKITTNKDKDSDKTSFRKRMTDYKPKPYPKFGHEFKGCYKDDGQRDLTHEIMPHDKKANKAEICVQNCADAGFKYAGTQYGEQCFCGNSYGKYGDAKNCDKKCPGNANEMCGGTWANSVYEIK